jgi:hypothetical protein
MSMLIRPPFFTPLTRGHKETFFTLHISRSLGFVPKATFRNLFYLPF